MSQIVTIAMFIQRRRNAHSSNWKSVRWIL